MGELEELDPDGVVFEKLISENPEKFQETRFIVSCFRGEHYLSLRKYFLSYDEGFIASREGISIKYEMSSSLKLLEALMEIIPLGECKHLIDAKLQEKDT